MANSSQIHKQSLEKRLAFIDLARGLAILLMIANHTAQHWIDASFGAPREWITELTHLLAPALFLFLAGLSLPLANAAAMAKHISQEAWAKKAKTRALWLLPIGYFLTLAIFPDFPTLLMGPLQTIGLTALFLIPRLPRLTQPKFQAMLTIAGILSYAIFLFGFDHLRNFSDVHPKIAQLLFWDVPPWPFASYILFGAVFGARWIACKEDRERVILLRWSGGIGTLAIIAAGLLALLGLYRSEYHIDLHILASPYMPFPNPVDALWTTGAAILALPFCSMLAKLPNKFIGWIIALGRHPLLIYVVHILISAKIAVQIFRWSADGWLEWTITSLALVIAMVLLSYAADWLQEMRKQKPRKSKK